MPDPTTPAKGLTQPTVGGDNNTWGGLLNTDLALIDSAFGGTLAKSISGNTTLSSTEAQNTGYEFTGTLSGTATITWPSFSGMAAIQNGTAGGFSITCGISGASVTVLCGETVAIWSDGTNFARLALAGGGIQVEPHLSSRISMYPGPSQPGITTVPMLVSAPNTVTTTPTNSCGLAQVLASMAVGQSNNGCGLEIWGVGGTDAIDDFILANEAIVFPPLRNQSVKLHSAGIYSGGTNNGPAVTLDSMVEASFRAEGSQIGSVPTHGAAGTCAVLIQPKTALPIEGFVGVTVSTIELGNISQAPIDGFEPNATLVVDCTHGNVQDNRIYADEISGAGPSATSLSQFGLQIVNTSSTYGFTGNHFECPYIHLTWGAGLRIGNNTSTDYVCFGNTYQIGEISPQKVGSNPCYGVDCYGNNEKIFVGEIDNLAGSVDIGIRLRGTAYHNVIIANIIWAATGIQLDSGAINNTIIINTSGVTTNIVDNSGGQNTIILNGELQTTTAQIVNLNSVQTINAIPSEAIFINPGAGQWLTIALGGSGSAVTWNGGWFPDTDNSSTLGYPSNRWSELYCAGPVHTGVYTVAALPAAGTAGRRAFVSDATVTTFASVAAGGGSNEVPVYDDGTHWRIG
jgi:hypothetical protein